MSDEKSQELEKDTSPKRLFEKRSFEEMSSGFSGRLDTPFQTGSKIDENPFDEMMLASRIFDEMMLAYRIEEKLNTERTYEGIPPAVRGSLAAILAREFIEQGVPPDFQNILKPLDKKGRDTVDSIPPAVSPPADADTTMSIEDGREPQDKGQKLPEEQVKERTRKELAQRFTYKDEKEIPPGVNPLQLDFLHDAALVGAFEWVREFTAEIITDYYTTETTLADLAKKYNITVPAVRERITRGLNKMRRVLYRDNPEMGEKDAYPLDQIQKGKERLEVLKSEKSRRKVSEASRTIIKKPATEVFRRKKN